MDATDLVLRIDRWSERRGSVSERLAAAIAVAIEDGRIAPGSRLPAERALAASLGISRGTVVRTYARLRQDGLAATVHGSGTVVSGADGAAGPDDRLRADGIVAAIGDHEPDAIDLRAAAWTGDAELAAAIAVDPAAHLQAVQHHDGYFPQGLPALRAAIARRLTDQGLPTDADQLLITNGAQQAIDVVVSTVTRPGDPVLLEETTWPGIVELLPLRHLRASTVPLAAHDHVTLLRALRERRADVAYLIPSFHNPTGAVIPAPVRRLIVEAAAESGVLVVEDLAIAELWIDEPPPPPLAACVPEASDRIVTIGSLSKTLWGGLRLGWIRADGALLRQLTSTKTLSDLGTAVPNQLAGLQAHQVADRIIDHRRRQLRERRDRALAAIEHHLPHWRIVPPPGGMSLWVDVGGADADLLALRARDRGVRVPAARVCSPDGRATGHLRLTLARPADEFDTAIERLADADRASRPSAVLGAAAEVASV